MEVVCLLGLPASAFRWRTASGAGRVTVVMKVTYDLAGEAPARAARQEVVFPVDLALDGNPRGLRAGSDLVPYKPRAEVFVSSPPFGVRRAGRGAPRLVCGPIDKTAPSARVEDLGAIAPSAPPRADLLGHHAATWAHGTYGEGLVVPDEIDFGYFNAGPTDQQHTGVFDGPIDLVLENLCTDRERVAVRLPQLAPSVVATLGARKQTVPMYADTVCVEPEALRATVLYRALFVTGPDENVGIAIIDGVGALAEALHDKGQAVVSGVTEVAQSGNEGPVLPFGGRAPARFESAPPRAVQATPPMGPIPAPGPVPMVARAPSPSTKPLDQPSYLRPEDVPRIPNLSPPAALAHPASAAQGGVARASDAASDEPAPLGRRKLEPRALEPRIEAHARDAQQELLELVWADERICADARRSKTLCAALATKVERRLIRRGEDPGDPDDAAAELARLLAHAPPVHETSALDALLLEGVGEAGFLTPPLACVAAGLWPRLDPKTLLEATVGMVKPMTSDRAVLESIEAAHATASNEWSAPRALETALARVREAASRVQRDLSAATLEANVERLVLERRAFESRRILGAEHLRADALFGDSKRPVPIYLPVECKDALPLFASFPARIIVEIHPRQDAVESHPLALRARAIARRMPLPR